MMMIPKKPLDKKNLIKPLIWAVFLLFLVVIGINLSSFVSYFFNKKVTAEKISTPKIYEPVVYPIQDWQSSKKANRLYTDELIHLIGQNPTMDKTLDFYGNEAVLHRFSTLSEPELSLADSNDILELSWYFAHPKDNETDKNLSVRYAQKDYLLASHIYGKDDKTLINAMLNKKSNPKLTGLLLAQCQGYICKLILDKKALHIRDKSTTKSTKD